MLKMYDKQTHGGNTPDFWEENWEVGSFEESLRFCAVDPLRPLFEKYSREGSVMLEGGCGLGQYLAYYASKGRRVVGLDFAQRALRALRQRQESLSLCAGDVSQLPFGDETFDLYYSGGVVEHFEGGADDSLREARRVLKKDGTLLISVPYYSPLRRVLAPTKTATWRKVSKPEVDTSEFGGQKFFQYVYRPHEFEAMLNAAGLKVIEKQGYAVLWGLAELPILGSGNAELKAHHKPREKRIVEAVDTTDIVKDVPRSLLKKLIVSEDADIPFLGLGVRFMRWATGNMMMYVCRRDDS